MEELLFVDACVRGKRSRTRMLAERFLSAYEKAHPAARVVRRDLCAERLEPQYPEVLERRDTLWRDRQWDDPLFAPARQFAAADTIVLAAPFWDLSFPAILKIYLERISVADITFGYTAEGVSVGLCRAKRLIFVTTRGGYFRDSPMEMGCRQLNALCTMYGIPEFLCLDAEGLDDVTRDAGAILTEAMGRAEQLARSI